jgi:hypothetical protein
VDSLEELPMIQAFQNQGYQEAMRHSKGCNSLCKGYSRFSRRFMFGRTTTSSFNYSSQRLSQGRKKIRILPKAYRGGPIKAAMNSPYLKVNKKAVEFYDDLPHDLKFSETFLEAVRKKIRIIRSMKAA